MRIAIVALALVAAAVYATRPRHPKIVRRFATKEGAIFARLMSQP